MTKTHEAAGEDGDESVNDGSVSDEEHPAGTPSHTSTPIKLVSHTKVSLYKLAIQYEYSITTIQVAAKLKQPILTAIR